MSWRGAPGAGCRTAVWIAFGLLALGGCEGDGGAPPPSPVVPAPPPAPPTPPAPPASPAPPMNVTAEAADATVTLRWAAPSGSEGISGYAVRLVPLDGSPPGDWIPVPRTERQYAFRGLTNGQSYLFEIRSVDDRATPADRADDLYSQSVSVSATPLASEPPTPARTWIGFADRRITLVEGGSVKLPLPFTGEPVSLDAVPDFPVDVASDAPESQLMWGYTTTNENGIGYFALHLLGVRDSVEEAPASYEIRLSRREPGIGISRGAGVLRVSVRDTADPGCSTLDLTSSRSPVADAAVRTGEFAFQGPEGAALRISGPYVTFIDMFPDDPPHPVISPVRLPYRELPREGHRQQFTVHWSGELALAAVAPGCEPVLLTCGAGRCDR